MAKPKPDAHAACARLPQMRPGGPRSQRRPSNPALGHRAAPTRRPRPHGRAHRLDEAEKAHEATAVTAMDRPSPTRNKPIEKRAKPRHDRRSRTVRPARIGAGSAPWMRHSGSRSSGPRRGRLLARWTGRRWTGRRADRDGPDSVGSGRRRRHPSGSRGLEMLLSGITGVGLLTLEGSAGAPSRRFGVTCGQASSPRSASSARATAAISVGSVVSLPWGDQVRAMCG